MDIKPENEKNGIDLAAMMRNDFSKAKIIFVTGYESDYCEDTHRFRPWGLLKKPINESKLLAYVNQVREEMLLEQNQPTITVYSIECGRSIAPKNHVYFARTATGDLLLYKRCR